MLLFLFGTFRGGQFRVCTTITTKFDACSRYEVMTSVDIHVIVTERYASIYTIYMYVLNTGERVEYLDNRTCVCGRSFWGNK